MQGMVIQMNDEQFLTLTQLQAFLDGTPTVDFSVLPAERYSIIARTVRRFGYPRLKRAQKAVVLRFQGDQDGLKGICGQWRSEGLPGTTLPGRSAPYCRAR
jgi:hypothetical protein